MSIIEPIVTDGDNTFQVGLLVDAINTSLGDNTLTVVSQIIQLPNGASSKLVFTPNGTQFVSGTIRIAVYWFKPFPLSGG